MWIVWLGMRTTLYQHANYKNTQHSTCIDWDCILRAADAKRQNTAIWTKWAILKRCILYSYPQAASSHHDSHCKLLHSCCFPQNSLRAILERRQKAAEAAAAAAATASEPTAAVVPVEPAKPKRRLPTLSKPDGWLQQQLLTRSYVMQLHMALSDENTRCYGSMHDGPVLQLTTVLHACANAQHSILF